MLRAVLEARWALLAPVIVLGGIYGGIFTPTEASVVAAVYGLLVGAFVYRQLDVAQGLQGAAQRRAGRRQRDDHRRARVRLRPPARRNTRSRSSSPSTCSAGRTNPFVVLMIINVGLIIIGTFMETLATIILLTPILLPLVVALGVDPIHFGILLVITSEIGFLTPPLGVNLFVAMGIANVTLEQISKAVVPYIVILTLVTVLLTALPEISLWLPRLLR